MSAIDVINPHISLFIEGVRTYFDTIYITSNIGQLPSASIQIPMDAGMLDIARYYSPKVHIFYLDTVTNTYNLLFEGIIASTNYSSSTSSGAGISFQCVHKYDPAYRIRLSYQNFDRLKQNDSGVVKVWNFSSRMSVIEALRGVSASKGSERSVSENNPVGDYDALQEELRPYLYRLKGITGIIVNLWNQLKSTGYASPEVSEDVIRMYIPLMEEGLKFFKRLSGHPVIETLLDSDRAFVPEASADILIPPSLKSVLAKAATGELAIEMLMSQLQFLGDNVGFMELIMTQLELMKYELCVLASPARKTNYGKIIDLNDPKEKLGSYVPAQSDVSDEEADREAIDVIVKPELPFYFSPKCNVFYPGLFSDVSLTEDNRNIPTRTTIASVIPLDTGNPLFIRGPNSIREAIAKVTDTSMGPLSGTFGSAKGRVGEYEWGVGIKPMDAFMPYWLSLLAVAKSSGNQIGAEAEVSDAGADFQKLSEGWIERYGWKDASRGGPISGYDSINPYSGNIQPSEQLYVASADYEHAKAMISSRVGSLTGVFNPYVLVGYPMDIIESSLIRPSIHAYCIGVTHSITSRSVQTSVTFSGAVTYPELATYYMPSMLPWLANSLGLASNQSIYKNDEAKGLANKFYFDVLGVEAAPPEDLLDLNTGIPLVPKSNISSPDRNNSSYQEVNLLSAETCLALVYRPIETLFDVERNRGVQFIDIPFQDLLNGSTRSLFPVNISFTPREESRKKLEIGESSFLDYSTGALPATSCNINGEGTVSPTPQGGSGVSTGNGEVDRPGAVSPTKRQRYKTSNSGSGDTTYTPVQGNFEEAWRRYKINEGITSVNNGDGAGLTKFGMTTLRYPNEDIRNMTEERAKYLLKRDWWDLVRAGEFKDFEVGFLLMDAATVMNYPRPIQMLREIVNNHIENKIPITSSVGNDLIAAANSIQTSILAEMRTVYKARYLSIYNNNRTKKNYTPRTLQSWYARTDGTRY